MSFSRWKWIHRLENDFLVSVGLIIGWEMTFQPMKWNHRLESHFLAADGFGPSQNDFSSGGKSFSGRNDFLGYDKMIP